MAEIIERAIVSGGRDFKDKDLVWSWLSWLKPRFIIVGSDRGADKLASDWAGLHGIPCAVVRSAWEKYNRAGGPIRNGWMLLLSPTHLIAFPGGRGTKDMIRKAIKANLEIYPIESGSEPPDPWRRAIANV